MQPRTRSTSLRPGLTSGSYSKMYSAGGATASALASTGATGGDGATLSLKDVQRCFEKERRAFLRDLESLRQQLVKKDQSAAKAAAVASQHAVQLKKEIASLQAALGASEKESAACGAQFRHTSALLETALDQHQADQAKLAELSETVRTMERKHEDALALVKKEAAASVGSTHEERKALRARVDQLRATLERERKEFLATKTPLSDQLAKANVRLGVLEKELNESRYRETASVQLKDKAQAETLQYKRKVADLASALQDALAGKSELKAAQQLLTGKMKDKWRELLAAHARANEQLAMLEEDYSALFRSRARAAEHSERVAQSMRALQQRHAQQLQDKDSELWELEKRFKRTSATCTACLKTPEQRAEALEAQLEAAREMTRREVTKEMELERWDRFQDVNAKFMDVSSELQVARRNGDQLARELKTLGERHEELQSKEKSLVEMLARAEKRVHELERKCSEDAQRGEESKRQIQELMENLSKMTTVTAEQSKQLKELELGRREEIERLKDAIAALDAEKLQLSREKSELQQQLDQQLDAYAQLQAEKAKQWNEIMGAQLSANLLIEEQAHTIDTLLKKSRYVSPSKASMGAASAASGSMTLPLRRERDPSNASGSSDSAPSSSSSAPSPSAGADESATVMVLRHECERLRDELTKLQELCAREKEHLQSEYEQKVVELMRELTALQRERAKLQRRLDAQAVTIHELTLQDDEDNDDDDGEEEQAHDNHAAFDDGGASDGEFDEHRRASAVRPLGGGRDPRQQQRPPAAMAGRDGGHEGEWTPKHRPSRSQPPAPTTRIRRATRSSGQYEMLAKELSARGPESDEEETVGMSFLSTTLS